MNSLDDFLGSEVVIKGLKSMIASERVSHAYIFDGAFGTGKKTLAKAFAKSLQCEKGGVLPCGECFSCKSLDSGDHPDVFFVDDTKATLGVDLMRDEVIEKAKTKPYCSKYKIFIINDAGRLTEQAQNSVLKTIEEPPAYGVFIFLASNYNAFLPTILSRCILIRLKGLSSDIIERELLKKGIDRNISRLSAACSGGSLGEALRLSADDEFFALREKAANILGRIEKADLMGLYDICAEITETDKRLGDFLSLLYLFYRDLLIYKTTGMERVIQKDYLGVIEDLCGRISLKRLLRGAKAVEEAVSDINMNVNKQLTLELMLFKIKEK
ncbi:MAG: DNA polymerase III subunit delta' [Clostridiales bacterium]|nr:DNA polymerase III subunit delta' [Clostridiales bacterium]